MMASNDQKDSKNESIEIGAGYPTFQMAKAFVSAAHHEDPEVQKRAEQRIAKWSAVISNTMSKNVTYGSRTPIKDVPNWATLEVLTGGFATGTL